MKKMFGTFTVLFVVFNLFLNTFSTLSTLSAYPSNKKLEGTLERLAIDGKDPQSGQLKSCDTRYFIRTDDGERHRISLPITTPPNLSPNQRITISGRWENGLKFVGENVEIIENVPIPTTSGTNTVHIVANSYLGQQILNNPESCGPQKTLVVMLGFTDIPAPTKTNKEEIEDIIFNNPLSVNAFGKECSRDENGKSKMWLEGGCLPEVVVLPYPASYFGYQQDEQNHELDLLRDAIAYSDDYIDFNKYDHIIFARMGNRWARDFSTLGKWYIKTQDGYVHISVAFIDEYDIVLDKLNASHEFLHGLGDGLLHAGSFSVSDKLVYPYGDWWSVMGGLGYGQIAGYQKFILGWLNIGQVEIIESTDSPQSVRLKQRELYSKKGKKLVIIPLGFDKYGRPTSYSYEYNKGLGKFDRRLYFFNKNKAVKPNNLILMRKEEIGLNYGSLVYMESQNNCLDLESEKFCDSESGVSIQVIQKTGFGRRSEAQLELTRTNPISPSVTLDAIIRWETLTETNRIIVIKVKVINGIGRLLRAGKIVCNIYNSSGEIIFKGTASNKSNAVFQSEGNSTGKYRVELTASKNGFVSAVAKTIFEIK